MENTKLDDLIASLNIDYSAVFVPQSTSRNAGEKHASLNWKVTIKRKGAKDGITTDYSQGIAHAPGYDVFANGSIHAGWKNRYFEKVVETGKYINPVDFYCYPMDCLSKSAAGHVDWFAVHNMHKQSKTPLPAPEFKDVLYSLVIDSDALQHASFEEWAQESGYDADSRKAEKIYKDCLKIALKLNSILGAGTLEKLREAFQDY